MKEAAAHQIEVVADATSSFGKGIKKSFKRHSKEVRGFARSFSELVDMEDILKSIHKVAYPSDHAKSSSIIHPTIDWSKYPPGTVIPPSEYVTTLVEEPVAEATAESGECVATTERKKSDATRQSPSSTRLNPKRDGSLRRHTTGDGNCARSASFSGRHNTQKTDNIPTTTPTQEYAARHLSARNTKENNDTKLKTTASGGSQRVSRDHSDLKQSKQFLSLFDENNKPIRRHSHTKDYVLPTPPIQLGQSNLAASSPPTIRQPKTSLTRTSSGVTKNYLDLGPEASFQRSPSMNDITRRSSTETPSKLSRSPSLHSQTRITTHHDYSRTYQDTHAHMQNHNNSNSSRGGYLDVDSSHRRPSYKEDNQLDVNGQLNVNGQYVNGQLKSPLGRSASVRNSKSNTNLHLQHPSQNLTNQKNRMCTRSSSMRVAKSTPAYV